MKRTRGFIGLIAILAILCGLAYIAYYGIGENKEGAIGSVDLGLDLAGGVSITYQAVGEERPTQADIDDTIFKLQQRVESYSTEAQVYQEGLDRINIEIPGVTDANKILEELGSPGNLYFIAQTNADGEQNYEYGLDDNNVYDWHLAEGKTIESLKKDGSIVLEGTDVASSEAGTQQSKSGSASEFVVELSFTPEGQQKFADATTKAKAAGESIGIFYDGHFVSVPNVENAITDGKAVITGNFDMDSATNLATTIRIGGLKVQLEELRSNVVGAQLGANAIATSLKGGILGIALVALFMLIMYLILGLSATVALAYYICLVIIFLEGLDITLTLPGIAGIILTIGMAVDANVLVFARVREELATGKAVRESMKGGYAKALSAILDGNITTMIAAIVLIIFASGTVKGFAYTLALGICVSMFTALVITRLTSICLYHIGCKAEKLYGLNRKINTLPIVEKRKVWYIISCALVGVGIVAMLVNGGAGKGALNWSLDFVGGTSTSVTFDKAYSLEELDNEVVPKIREVTGISSVQTQTVAGSNEVIFKTLALDLEQRTAMEDMLEADYNVANENIAAETISPTIGKEMTNAAIRAIIIALILMLLYIRLRFRDFKFGFAAILALAHDAFIVITCYALTRIEVGGTFIAVILTIIGYSINNTIVTFDRIRENQKWMPAPAERVRLVDESVTQTLTRTLFTSATTFIMVFALFIFGVNDIRNFTIPMMVGLICGTYTSICIATALWYQMKKDKVK